MIDNNLSIYITTYKRPDKQRTLYNLPTEVSKEVFLVVRESEAEQHLKHKDRCKDILVLPSGVDTFAKTRQWAFDHCKTKYVIFMDDDLTFSVRNGIYREEGMRKIRSAEEFETMFSELVSRAREFKLAHLTICPIEVNRWRKETAWYLNDKRYMRFYMYDKEILVREDIKISRVSMMLDFDVALQLLAKGYAFDMNYKYSQGHENSNTPGGCSEERNSTDPDGLKEATLLQSLHPKFVKVVKKKFKESWNATERYDVKISWKKAYKTALRYCLSCEEERRKNESCCEPVSAKQLHPD